MATNEFKLITFTVLIAVSTLGLTNAQWAIDDDGCRTPDRGVGNCVIIRECPTILNFLQQTTTITQEVANTLRTYTCGFEGKSAKVCCPDKPISIKVADGNSGTTSTQVTSTTTTTTTQKPVVPVVPVISTIPIPPDVTNHKNFQLLPSIADCGPLPSRNRIINGNKTGLYEFPWMALLSYRTRSGPDFRCGGTLINERYILTAAHCITHLENLTLIGVRLGEYNISSVQDCEMEGKSTLICADPVQDVFIDEVIPHPNYNLQTYSDDIGLIRLSLPAQMKESVQPICLPVDETLRNKNFENAKLIVTGWGATGQRTRRSEDLLKVELPIIPEAECKAAYTQTPAVINYKRLCAGGKNKRDSCGGDSGGPLQALENVDDDVHFVQHGIVSFGPRNCGQEGFPGVYTRIDYYMDWILDNIRA